MATLNGLPIYKMKPGMGVDFHSLVSDPAIEVLYKTFSKSPRYNFNQEKQIITGPFMIPDLPIYRNDASHGEYYVVFDKQTILDLNEMFMKEQKTLSFNYQHMDNSKVEGAVLVENWIVGEGDTKAKALGFDVPVGTWMGSVKINNADFWQKEIKSGNVKGFSIEGYLDIEMAKQFPKQKHTLGNIQKYDIVKRAQNNDLYISGTIELGNYVYYNQPSIVLIGSVQQELRNPIWENNVELADGRVLVLDSGKIIEIIEKNSVKQWKDKKDKMKKTFKVSAKTKDGTYTLATEAESFVEGVDVYTVAEDGTQTPAVDGDYIMEDGSTITVSQSKITKIMAAIANADDTAEIEALLKALMPSLEIVMKKLLEPIQTELKEVKEKFSKLPSVASQTTNTDTEQTPGKETVAVMLAKLKLKLKK